MKILVIDIGGSRVKFTIWGRKEIRAFPSSMRMTPRLMMKRLLSMTEDWKYDAVAVGYPGPVMHGRPVGDPPKLGKGWARFRFENHFKKPVKVINDAAMQALGSYRGGRMLFIGLGTGLGSTLILDDVVIPLELGELSYSKTKKIHAVLGKQGLARLGRRKWEEAVHDVVNRLTAAFRTDSLVLGGGNARLLKRLPRGARRGSNAFAFAGGARLWRVGALYARAKKHTWVIT